MNGIFDSDAAMKDDGFTEPPAAPKPEPTTPPSTQVADEPAPEVPKAATNSYVVQRGDTPWKVAAKLYGQGSKGRDIVLANPGVDWNPGDVLTLL